MLVKGQVKADDMSGPVGIVSMIGDTYEEARQYGFMDVLLNLANITILLRRQPGSDELAANSGFGRRQAGISADRSNPRQTHFQRKKALSTW